jgi:hypothetical protein
MNIHIYPHTHSSGLRTRASNEVDGISGHIEDAHFRSKRLRSRVEGRPSGGENEGSGAKASLRTSSKSSQWLTLAVFILTPGARTKWRNSEPQLIVQASRDLPAVISSPPLRQRP